MVGEEIEADECPEHQAAVAAHVAPKEGGNRGAWMGIIFPWVKKELRIDWSTTVHI